LTKTGGGVIALAGAGSWTGGTIINDGELRIRTTSNRLPTTTDLTINSPGILNLNGVNQQIGSLTGNGRVGLAGATFTVNGATSTTFSGVIEVTANAGASGSTAAGGALTKTGASTLTLTGDNTYTGATTINTNNGALSIGDGGTSGTLVSSVNVNNAGATLIFNRSDDSSYGGIVSGVGGVRKEGAGVLTINHATNEWTNTGSITINGGAIRFGTSAIGFATATPVVVNAAGTLDMNNINDTFGSLAGAGAVLQGSGNLTLGAASGTTTFSGAITGSGIFRKGRDLPTGAADLSIQVLSGNNSLGDVRVNAGSLLINGTTSASVSTSVNGGVLGGTGSLTGLVTVNSGGRLGAGVGGGNAIFNVDALTLEAGSILRPTLGAAGSPLGSSDVANVVNPGAFTLNGSTLEIATANGVADGTYRVLKYNGTYAGAIGNLANSTQAGFDLITIIDNTTDGAIDVAIDITERSWVDDTGAGDWSVGTNWGANPTEPNGPGAIANFVATTPNNPVHLVTLDNGDKSVGVVNMINTTNYTIAASGAN
jgi:autotransporter-associated beta strand protein